MTRIAVQKHYRMVIRFTYFPLLVEFLLPFFRKFCVLVRKFVQAFHKMMAVLVSDTCTHTHTSNIGGDTLVPRTF